MKKVLLLSSFLPITFLTLSISFFLILNPGFFNAVKVAASEATQSNQEEISASIDDMKYIPDDTAAQIVTVEEFMQKYRSPLTEHAQYIVEVSNTYGIDYRLIPAIAMQESSLCKKIPRNSYNCWGYGIYGGKIARFSNYKEAIERVAYTLSESYVKKGYTTIDQIMSKYTPDNTNNWASAVSHFMGLME